MLLPSRRLIWLAGPASGDTMQERGPGSKLTKIHGVPREREVFFVAIFVLGF